MPDASYLEARLLALGITEELNTQRVTDDSPKGWHHESYFREDRDGNILIQYFDLEGTVATYEAGRHRTEKPYRVKRLAEPQGKRKYVAPSGTASRIFHPPRILEAFAQERQIETLFVVEGQFKAFKGAMHGLDIVAIQGIWNFREKGASKLKDDLDRLISRCKVRNVVLLFDADARQITYEEGADLTKRLWSFFLAVRTCRELLKAYELDFYFAHLQDEYVETAKGLDDLLVKEKGQEEAVIADLLQLEQAKEHVVCLNLTDKSLRHLRGHFFLNSVEAFYQRFQGQIGEAVFSWNRGRYQFDEETGAVELLKHPDAFRFLRVGTDYFKEIETINSKQEINRILKPWKKGEIIQDYCKQLRLARFLEWIDKYDEFTNLPDHSDQFQKFITTPNGSKAYNLYHPIEHRPEPGEWPAIEGFLKHVFGESEAPSGHAWYTMGLDYLTILWRMPAHKLPVLVLVNQEGRTGKSTFINFLRDIFGPNATFCGNDDLTDSFNSSWVTKLLALIDEGVIEKRVVLEKVKSMTTSPRVKLHGKGRDKVESDLFVKFVFTSNDEDNCIPVSPTERRFWVIKVPTFEGPDKPDLLEDMRLELPAFLHFLGQREIVHPRKGQLWFEREDIITPALQRLIKGSKSWIEKEIIEVAREKMLDFQVPQICLTYSDLELEVCRHKRFQRWEILNTLRKRLKVPQKNGSFTRYFWIGEGEHRSREEKRDRGRYYLFKGEDFLTPEELEEVSDVPV